MTPLSSTPNGRKSGGFLTDTRFIRIAAQAAVVALLAVAFWYLVGNMVTNLRSSSIPMNFNFLGNSAGFAISEGPTFNPVESYARAFFIGVVNTLRIAMIGIVLATILGLIIGLARLATNWLVSTLAGVYVEILRNIPLLVQLFFWYTAVVIRLPGLDNALRVGDVFWLSNRGIALSWLYPTHLASQWFIWLGAGLVAGAIAWLWQTRRNKIARTAKSGFSRALLVFVAIAAVGYLVTWYTAALPENISYTITRGDRGTLYVDTNGDGSYTMGVDEPMRRIPITLQSASGADLGSELTGEDGTFRFQGLPEEGVALTWESPGPLVYSEPILQGFNVLGGRTFTPEFTALLLGLVIYTSAFIAEIVRAGVNSVPMGQWEASRAMGLPMGKTLRMIVLPQALRVIIPPLTNQYLNLTKNSSLAMAVGYPDLFNISMTILNQSGAAVQMFLIIMMTYLSFSLITSLIMNWYNKRIMLVER